MPDLIQQPLADRFRGAMLGAALGEILGANYQHHLNAQINAQTPVNWLEVGNWGFEPLPDSTTPGWGHIAIQQAREIEQGRLREAKLEKGQEGDRGWSTGWSIATLPFALVYHENWHFLQQTLKQTVEANQPSAHFQAVELMAYFITLTLQDQLYPETSLAYQVQSWQSNAGHPDLVQPLQQVQSWLQQNMGMAGVSSFIERTTQATSDAVLTPVSIALYCFLSTPHHFRLSMLRAARLRYYPQVTCALVGALSGSYNGMAGIPWEWRRKLRWVEPSPLAVLWQIAHEADLLQQADRLTALWAGVYEPANWLHSSVPVVTASPGVIRERYRA